jgi:hypothetical protein
MQVPNILAIAREVALELLPPVFRVRFGHVSRAAAVPVPEASVHEYDGLPARKGKVGPPRQAR